MIKLILFGIGTSGILTVSWPSLRHPCSHGFYRFFAFEAILALILINIPHWFRRPFSAAQIFSWMLLLASLFLVAHGVHLLRSIGEPQGKVESSPNLGFENTAVLVTIGAYRYIRHPLYASLLYLGWGAFLKNPSVLGRVLALVASAALVATARVEEKENLRKFGTEYAAYMKRTRMFIPYIL